MAFGVRAEVGARLELVAGVTVTKRRNPAERHSILDE
jgi:hypothetical protein